MHALAGVYRGKRMINPCRGEAATRIGLFCRGFKQKAASKWTREVYDLTVLAFKAGGQMRWLHGKSSGPAACSATD